MFKDIIKDIIMTYEINDKNVEGMTREDYFDIHSNTIAICEFNTECRKQSIRKYIEDGGEIFKYDDTMLIPQISYNKLEYTRFNIDKFYNDKLNFIDYGSSSPYTSHYLYRHRDGNVYNVIITQQYMPDIISDETTNIKNNDDTYKISNIFLTSKTFIKNSFYFKLDLNENNTSISYYPGCWSIMDDNF